MQKLKYIILGGGMVAGYAAKELASRGLKSGELAIISADTALPYERPPLSKGFLSGKDDETNILINGADWYRERGIEVRLNTVIERIDPNKRLLRSNSGEEFECHTYCWPRVHEQESSMCLEMTSGTCSTYDR